MKQTAVQWIASNLGEHIFWEEKIIDLVEKALEMEKEQICDAFYYGVDVDSFCVNNPYKVAENYYKENYEAQND